MLVRPADQLLFGLLVGKSVPFIESVGKRDIVAPGIHEKWRSCPSRVYRYGSLPIIAVQSAIFIIKIERLPHSSKRAAELLVPDTHGGEVSDNPENTE